jgi:hypothetical protein
MSNDQNPQLTPPSSSPQKICKLGEVHRAEDHPNGCCTSLRSPEPNPEINTQTYEMPLVELGMENGNSGVSHEDCVSESLIWSDCVQFSPTR